jgi:hypothetical protein
VVRAFHTLLDGYGRTDPAPLTGRSSCGESLRLGKLFEHTTSLGMSGFVAAEVPLQCLNIYVARGHWYRNRSRSWSRRWCGIGLTRRYAGVRRFFFVARERHRRHQ